MRATTLPLRTHEAAADRRACRGDRGEATRALRSPRPQGERAQNSAKVATEAKTQARLAMQAYAQMGKDVATSRVPVGTQG